MPGTQQKALIAVDVGNARMKFGLFRGLGECPDFRAAGDCPDFRVAKMGLSPSGILPEPERTLSLPGRCADLRNWPPGLAKPNPARMLNGIWRASIGRRPRGWWIGFARRGRRIGSRSWPRATCRWWFVCRVPTWWAWIGCWTPWRPIGCVRRAARQSSSTWARPSPWTWSRREGFFMGGAILPGIAMSARALHEFTDLLPLVDMLELAEPAARPGRLDRGGPAIGAVLGRGGRGAAVDRAIGRRRPAAGGPHRRGQPGGGQFAPLLGPIDPAPDPIRHRPGHQDAGVKRGVKRVPG